MQATESTVMLEKRVLVVDDDRDFADSMCEMLEPEGYTVRTANSIADGEQAAADFHPHAALIDICFEKGSGTDLLHFFQQKYPETLCIMITAHASLESAIESVEFGAFDYLTKPCKPEHIFQRLARCFDRLKLAAEKQAIEEKLRLTRFVSDHASECILWINEQANICYANEEACREHGYSQEEMLDLSIPDIDPDFQADAWPAHWQELKQEGKLNFETRHRRKDGSVFPMDVSAKFVRFGDKEFNIGYSRNITERKLAEEQSLALNRILEESLNEIYTFDARTLKFIQVNYGARLNLGYEMDELKELTPVDLKQEFTPESFMELIEPLKNGKQEKIEFSAVHYRKDGSTYPVEVHLQLSEMPSGKVFIAIVLDITERKASERELHQTMWALRERVKEQHCLYRLYELSEAGLSNEEYLRQSVQLLPPAWQYPEITCACIEFGSHKFHTKNFDSPEKCHDTQIIIHGEKFGKVSVCYLKEMPETDQGPFLFEEVELLRAFADHLGRVIEHRQLEEALRESQQRLQLINENMPDYIFQISQDGIITYVNRTPAGILEADILGTKFIQWIQPQKDKDFEDAMRQVFENRVVADFESQSFTTGTFYSNRIKPVITDSGVSCAILVAHDMTVRKKIEAEVIEREKHFRALFQSVGDYALVLEDMQEGPPVIVDANEAAFAKHGYTREEMIGKPISFLDSESSHQRFSERMDSIRKGGSARFEAEHVCKDGSTFSVENVVRLVEHQGKRLFYSVERDITERKRMILELSASRKKFEELFRAANEGVALHELVFDSSGKPVDFSIIDVNPAYERILGISREQAIGSLASALYGAGEAPFLDTFARVAMSGEPASFEIYFEPMGKYFHVASFSPAKNMFANMFSDISERKHAEEKERTYREKLERFNKMAVGRELTMIDLKKEINALLAELGRDGKYIIHEPEVPGNE